MGSGYEKILRKLEQNIPLQDQEYEQLMDYIDQLRQSAPQSYALFCQQYGVILWTLFYLFTALSGSMDD